MEHLAVIIPIASIVFIFAAVDILGGWFGLNSREPTGDDRRR